MAGICIWADAPPSPSVSLCPVDTAFDASFDAGREVLSACVVTCAMRKAEPEVSEELGDADFEALSMSDFPLSMPQSELMQEQVCESFLKELFDCVLSAAEIKSAATSYFLHNGLLFRKGVVLDSDWRMLCFSWLCRLNFANLS